MDQLSSCYFCGGALDVSLSEYPVVPKDLRADRDEHRTVVLCGTCREKLAIIVEDVVAATDTEAAKTEGPPFEDRGGDSVSDGRTDGETPAAPEHDDAAAAEPADKRNGGATEPATNQPTDGTTAEAPDDDTDDGPSLSRLEYNKVMRLLKNREFPVDRMEIRDVATSAYGISPEEFDAVVEAAIERDLLAEADGQFVEPS